MEMSCGSLTKPDLPIDNLHSIYLSDIDFQRVTSRLLQSGHSKVSPLFAQAIFAAVATAFQCSLLMRNDCSNGTSSDSRGTGTSWLVGKTLAGYGLQCKNQHPKMNSSSAVYVMFLLRCSARYFPIHSAQS